MSTTFVYALSIAVAVVTLYGLVRAFGHERREEGDESAGDSPSPEIRVLSRRRIGRGTTLVIVEVEGRRLLLGSTRSQWCALADLGSTATSREEDPFAPFDTELARAMHATRYRRGWKHS